MAKKKPTKMLAVLARSRRGGRWSIASQSSVLAVLGACHLDMRRSSVDGETFKMKVTVFLGSATFILPPGASVKPSGVTILAKSLVDVPETEEQCTLPTMEIEWTTVFGRVHIVTGSLTDEAEEVAVISPAPIEAQLVGENAQTASTVVAAAIPAATSAAPASPDVEVTAQPGEDPPALDLNAAEEDEPSAPVVTPSEEVSRHAAIDAGSEDQNRGRRSEDVTAVEEPVDGDGGTSDSEPPASGSSDSETPDEKPTDEPPSDQVNTAPGEVGDGETGDSDPSDEPAAIQANDQTEPTDATGAVDATEPTEDTDTVVENTSGRDS